MSSRETGLSIDARRHFLQALRRVLRPIIRLLIRNGIRYDEFADVARGAYVESAIRYGIETTSRPTRERVTLITGIPRQQVDHYIDDEDSLPKAETTLTNVLVETLHKWHTDPRYLGPDRVPLELQLDARSGLTFKGLVAQVNAEVNPDVVLEELLRAKSVVQSGERLLRAVTRCFIWPQGGAASMEHFGSALTQLVETHEYNFNCTHTEGKRLERSVFADQGLPEKLLPDFQAHAQERADRLLFDLDDWLARSPDADAGDLGPRVTAGINVFLYADPQPTPETLSNLVQPRRNPGLRSKGSS